MGREFGSASEASVFVVEFVVKGLEGLVEDSGGDFLGDGGDGSFEDLAEAFGEFVGGFEDLLAVVLPGVGEAGDELEEGGDSLAGDFGEIGSGEEGFLVGGEEDGHGPAAVSGGELDGGHVDVVDVGSFFAVEFDADEVPVEGFGDFWVFEGLVGHDMAPVAGGIAYAEEDGFVLASGVLPHSVGPFLPVDGVVSVLSEVGRGGLVESVGHLTL